MDYIRLQLLERLYKASYSTTTAVDFNRIEEFLSRSDFLVTYTAGPYATNEQTDIIEAWVAAGGRWLALHGTSGGKAARIEGTRQRRMVRLSHHDTLGAFFLNHPPIRKFKVKVEDEKHPLFNGLPSEFEVEDELYIIEPMADTNHLLTTQLPADPSPEGFGFVYDEDNSILPDGTTRVLGTERQVGSGRVAYIALGHCHAPSNNSQPFVDESVADSGETPKTFRGVWANEHFNQILDNAMDWAQQN